MVERRLERPLFLGGHTREIRLLLEDCDRLRTDALQVGRVLGPVDDENRRPGNQKKKKKSKRE